MAGDSDNGLWLIIIMIVLMKCCCHLEDIKKEQRAQAKTPPAEQKCQQ